MKNVIAVIILLLSNAAISQDTLQFKNGTAKVVQVSEIFSSEIKYYIFGELNSPLYIVNTQDLNKLILKNGQAHTFGDTNTNTKLDSIPVKNKIVKLKPSDFGHYISTSAGYCSAAPNLSDLGYWASYSFAYKSHLLTVTEAHSSSITNGTLLPGEQVFDGNYFGILLGESIRLKWLMCSASLGVGFTNLNISVRNNYSSYQTNTIFNGKNIISMPFEFKAFFTLPQNGIGIGFHLIKDVAGVTYNVPHKYDPLYFGFSVVTGFWNKTVTK